MANIGQEIMAAFSAAINREGSSKQEAGSVGEGIGMLLEALGGASGMTHSKGAEGGDADMREIKAGGAPFANAVYPSTENAFEILQKTMRDAIVKTKRAPAREGSDAVPGNYEPPSPAEVLNRELTIQAGNASADALQKMQTATVAADRLQTTNAVVDMTNADWDAHVDERKTSKIRSGNVSMEDALRALAVPLTDENIANTVAATGTGRTDTTNRVVLQRLPKGNFFTVTSPNLSQEIDPRTGETLLMADVPKPIGVNNQNDSKVTQAVIKQGGKPEIGFDLTKELEKSRNLKGNDLREHAITTMTNIDMAMSAQMKRIRDAASMESGYTSAQAALQRNIMLDESSGFMARVGAASAQTVAAQELVTQALAVKTHLEKGILMEDSKMAELSGAKERINKIMLHRADQEVTSDMRQTQRKEIAADAAAVSLANKKELRQEAINQKRDIITPIELANYHHVYGTVNDDKDRDNIMARRGKDPIMNAVLSANTDNIYNLLTDTNPRMREAGLKLILEYEKDGNILLKGASTTPIHTLIKNIVMSPDMKGALTKGTLSDEEKKTMDQEFLMANKSGKELETLRANKFPMLLARQVNIGIYNAFSEDVKTWKGPGINDDSPLAKTVKEIALVNPANIAPLGSVIDKFVSTKVLGPDGKPIDLKAKINMMVSALSGAADNTNVNMIVTPETVAAAKDRLINRIKNQAAATHIQNRIGFTSYPDFSPIP